MSSTNQEDPAHVFNPISRSWVKRGSQVHTRLIAAGLLPEPPAPIGPPATTRGNHMRGLTVLKRRIDATLASGAADDQTRAVLGNLLREFEAEMRQPRAVGGPRLAEREGPVKPVRAPKGVATVTPVSKPPPRRRRQAAADEDSSPAQSPVPRRPPPSTAAVRAHARKLLSAKIEQIMNDNQTEFSSLSEGEVEDRISQILRGEAAPSASAQSASQ
jgi:hypothetical protein